MLRAFAGFFGALGLPWFLFLRRRRPESIVVLTVVAGVILSLGATMSWVALGGLYKRRRNRFFRDPWLWGSTLGVTANTYLMVLRDLASPDSRESIIGIFLDTPPGTDWAQALPRMLEVIVTLALMGLVIGFSLAARSRSVASTAREQVRQVQEHTQLLGHELARYEERAKIAAELHDSLGHKLAQLSLLSGAVAAQSQNNPDQTEEAKNLQEVAIEATDALHDLVRTFKAGTPPDISLQDLHQLINDTKAFGLAITAHIDIDTTHPIAPHVERAIYRVVQEITTNAAKHAPNQPLTLYVTGGVPRGGIEIRATNPLPPTPLTVAPTGGFGLIGAAERVEYQGGWLRYAPMGGHFVVHAWIPCPTTR